MKKTFDNIKAEIAKESCLQNLIAAIMQKETKNYSEQIITTINGTSSLDQAEQNNEDVKKAINENKVQADAFMQLQKFVNDAADLYKQITGRYFDF